MSAKKYNPELRTEAVRMIRDQKLTHREVSQKLGIPLGTIGSWMRIEEERSKVGPGELTPSELRRELAEVKKELKEAKIDNEILKKAAAYFAKGSLQSTRS